MLKPSSYGIRVLAANQSDTGVGRSFSLAEQQWKYLSYDERLPTFKVAGYTWPKYAEKTPEQLARCYFIYIGTADRVHCLYCDPYCENVVSQWQDEEEVNDKHGIKCIALETVARNRDRYWSYCKYPMVDNIYAMDFAAWGLRYTGIGHTTCDYCGYKQTVWGPQSNITHGHTQKCLFPMLHMYKERQQNNVAVASDAAGML